MRHIAVFFHHLKVGKKRHIQFNLDGHLLFFAGTRSKKGELVIVMSNQDKGLKILAIYKRRWTIELLFAHCKKNGFNLEDTHLIDLERIEKLFAIVCSALLLCFMVRKVEEKKSPTPFKKICTKVVKNIISDTQGVAMSKTYLTATALAARWHLTPHTLSQWRWNGYGPRFSKMGKHILYELKHVEAFEERAVHQNTSYQSLNRQEID